VTERDAPERAADTQVGTVEVAVDLDALDEGEVPAVDRIAVGTRRFRARVEVGEQERVVAQHGRSLQPRAQIARDRPVGPVLGVVPAQVGRDLERGALVQGVDQRAPSARRRIGLASEARQRRVAPGLGRERHDLVQERGQIRPVPRPGGVECPAETVRRRQVLDVVNDPGLDRDLLQRVIGGVRGRRDAAEQRDGGGEAEGGRVHGGPTIRSGRDRRHCAVPGASGNEAGPARDRGPPERRGAAGCPDRYRMMAKEPYSWE
jgi:hypothetical protein